MAACSNCFVEMTGEYCAACGERRVRPDDLSAIRFLHDLVDQLANFRFKFKTLRSIASIRLTLLLV
jgi:hypothetical protein